MLYATTSTKPSWLEAARSLSAFQWLKVVGAAMRDGGTVGFYSYLTFRIGASLDLVTQETNCTGQNSIIDAASELGNCTIIPGAVTSINSLCVGPDFSSCPPDKWGDLSLEFALAGKGGEVAASDRTSFIGACIGFGVGAVASVMRNVDRLGVGNKKIADATPSPGLYVALAPNL